jgi:hypothetical protein
MHFYRAMSIKSKIDFVMQKYGSDESVGNWPSVEESHDRVIVCGVAQDLKCHVSIWFKVHSTQQFHTCS